MDWKSFISELVGALAWPIVILVISYQLKDNLGEIILRLKKLKHKDTELEFTEKINELVIEREAEQKDERHIENQRFEDDENINFLFNLADVSPRNAIQESFRVLENSAFNTLARVHPKIYGSGIRKPYQLLNMLKGEILSPHQYHEFNELRKLRNHAEHDIDFDLRGMPIEAYIKIAISLARRLDAYKP